jgi:hypothetical protein
LRLDIATWNAMVAHAACDRSLQGSRQNPTPGSRGAALGAARALTRIGGISLRLMKRSSIEATCIRSRVPRAASPNTTGMPTKSKRTPSETSMRTNWIAPIAPPSPGERSPKGSPTSTISFDAGATCRIVTQAWRTAWHICAGDSCADSLELTPAAASQIGDCGA